MGIEDLKNEEEDLESQEEENEVEEHEGEQEEEEISQEEAKELRKKLKKTTRRNISLLSQRNTARTEATFYKGKSEGASHEVKKPVRPTLKEFQDDDGVIDEAKYSQALDTYEKDTMDFNKKISEPEKPTKKKNVALEGRLNKAREKYEDFDEVAFDESIPYCEPMTEAVMVSKVGPEIAYYFGDPTGDGPDVAAEITELSQTDILEARKRVLDIENKFLKPDSKKKVKRLSKPIDPVHSGKKLSDKKKLNDTMPIKDWMAQEKANRLKKVKENVEGHV